jgi:hypothetical protein
MGSEKVVSFSQTPDERQDILFASGANPMTITELELRVATLEQKLAHLAGKVEESSSQDINAWIDQIHGTFQDDATYRQAALLGRKWRKSRRRPVATRPRKASVK